MLTARRYVIGGRVQGVGFRYFSQAAAAREGIGGWARNTADGDVEVFAEGDVESLDRFERQLRHGPPRARVECFEWSEATPTGHETGFTIA